MYKYVYSLADSITTSIESYAASLVDRCWATESLNIPHYVAGRYTIVFIIESWTPHISTIIVFASILLSNYNFDHAFDRTCKI